MRLQSIQPPLPTTLLDALEKIDIKTDADLLFSARPSDVFQRLPQGTVSLHDFFELISRVNANAAAPAIRGDQHLATETKRFEDIFPEDMLSGIPQLDALVGGFGGPRVIEISGDRYSGKTALVLQIVLRHLSRSQDSAALWIDTTGDFTAERALALLESYREEFAGSALERLQVALAFDIEAVHEVLEAMRSSLASNSESTPVMRCVVIDAITPLIGPLLSAVSSQGHAIMTSFMRQLRALGEAYSLTILVINSSSGSSPRNRDSAFLSTIRKPALGPSFTFTTDTTIWLSKDSTDENTEDGARIHVAEVLRSRSTLSKTWCTFRVKDGLLSGD